LAVLSKALAVAGALRGLHDRKAHLNLHDMLDAITFLDKSHFGHRA
jgi:hypothetical protein